MRDEITIYRSGMSRVNHVRACADARVPVGVVAGELSANARGALVAYLDAGGRAFVDSGEYPAFQNRLRQKRDARGRLLPQYVDYGRVLSLYRRLAQATARPKNLALVMPDEIGNQARTLELLALHRDEIRALGEMGCELLVPLQRGALSLAECHAAAVSALGTDRFTVSISSVPSNKEAATEAEVLDFAREVRPRRLHLLGLAKRSALRARAERLRRVSPFTRLSADSNHLAARVGKGRSLTVAVERRVEAEGERLAHDMAYEGDADFGFEDFTEFVYGVFNTPAYLTPSLARTMAALVTSDEFARRAFVRAALSERLLTYTREEEERFEEDYGGQFSLPGSELGRWLQRHCYPDEDLWRCYETLVARAATKVRARIAREELAKSLAAQDAPAEEPPLLAKLA